MYWFKYHIVHTEEKRVELSLLLLTVETISTFGSHLAVTNFGNY